MNYREQEEYLLRSRIWAMAAVAVLLVVSWFCLHAAAAVSRSTLIVFVLVAAALSGSLLYTPDYLQLTVNPEKRPRWEIKIRWRIVAAVLIIGMAAAHSNQTRIIVIAAAAWLALMNLIAAKMIPWKYFGFYFWVTDLVLLAALFPHLGFICWIILSGSATHLLILVFDRGALVAGGAIAVFAYRLTFSFSNEPYSLRYSAAALFVVVSLSTLLLLMRSRWRHLKNVVSALRELMEFTGYTKEHVQQLWSTSNQELAKNWEAAAIPENDSERMTQWYRDNSELYMFAISAYNLEYKRIISNIKVLRYAKGACLDYGAGNGELVLDMARNGHPAAYYDVDGVSKRFAQYRAAQQKLDVKFASSKEELEKIVHGRGLDTIFSFDVLEHLPDLAGELSFLSSLLNPGGLFMFDLPAGSTKAHPMHLNHNLDFHAHLRSLGMEEKRSALQKLPFWKQEKYIFIRQALVSKEAQGLSGSR